MGVKKKVGTLVYVYAYLCTSSVLCLAAVLSSSWWRGTAVSSSVLTSLLGGGAMVRVVVTLVVVTLVVVTLVVVTLVVVRTSRVSVRVRLLLGRSAEPAVGQLVPSPGESSWAALCRLGLCKLANVATTTLSLLHNV